LSFRDDEPYRREALNELLDFMPRRNRALSLVDRVVRAILSAQNTGIDAFLTYNPADYADACAIHHITLIDQHIELPQLVLA
jgi:hypothetical protein